MLIVRYDAGHGPLVGKLHESRIAPLPFDDISSALRMTRETLRETIQAAPTGGSLPLAAVQLLAPVDRQEVWAAGVTYLRSRQARLEESDGADVYERVYAAPRPELFFKCAGWRSVGTDDTIGVRNDSRWNLPEPELAVVVNSDGQVIGYTAGNDVSSRDIEGENALYLPQAKVYERSCALGPGIRPWWELDPTTRFNIELIILRNGAVLTQGSTDTSRMVRGIDELVEWLRRALPFPDGVVLMTGTGVVPPSDVSIAEGDEVVVSVSHIGELRNRVMTVGRPIPSPRKQSRLP